jgi:hypothetical protein
VLDLTLHKDIKKLKKSPYGWAIALYRDGCGYCELLKPEWTAAAGKMRKMAGVVRSVPPTSHSQPCRQRPPHCRSPAAYAVASASRSHTQPHWPLQAAVDVVNHKHIADSLMKEYGFEVKGVPTVIMLKPGPDGKKELVKYEGERKTKAIVKALTNVMPEFVARITEPSFATWQRKPGAKIVLFSKKREPSSQLKVPRQHCYALVVFATHQNGIERFCGFSCVLFEFSVRLRIHIIRRIVCVSNLVTSITHGWTHSVPHSTTPPPPPPPPQALSTKYRDRNISFGIVDQTDVKMRSLFSVNDFPKLFAVEAGQRVGEGGYTPVEYTRGNSFVSLDFFVMDFASEKPSSGGAADGGAPAPDPTSSTGSKSSGGSTSSKAGDKPKTKAKSSPAKKKAKPPPAPPKKSTTVKRSPTKKRSPTLSGKLRTMPQPSNPIRLKGADLSKLSVKELRGVLARWDDPCSSCLEKSNFVERITKHRKTHGDMESVAQHYAKRAKAKERRAAKKQQGSSTANGESNGGGGGGGGGNTDGEGDTVEDDPFCTRMLEVETVPLQDKIEELESENAELRRQLALVSEPLIREDL